jgi:hypothetical protein
MKQFAEFLRKEVNAPQLPGETSSERIEAMRQLADAYPQEVLRFRCTIARDFLAHIRDFARTIKLNVLITCNNSLNSPGVLYAQCRTYGYNIWELSKVEDFVVVEDMVSQPRIEADGRVFEYGPMYKQLHAISHGKPIVAVTLANGDYHTPPNLVRLAMAEAAAHGASYLFWPTWPENQRERMVAAIRPQADFLGAHETLLNDATFRADVLLFLPFRRWAETDHCAATVLAAEITRANIQYQVISEGDFDLAARPGRRPVLLLESMAVLAAAQQAAVDPFQKAGGRVIAADEPDWPAKLKAALIAPSVVVQAPPTVRAVVRDQPDRVVIHLLNLNVQRLSSFEDQVTAARDVKLAVRVPFSKIKSLSVHTADERGTSGPLKFDIKRDEIASVVTFTVPYLEVAAVAVIEAQESPGNPSK